MSHITTPSSCIRHPNPTIEPQNHAQHYFTPIPIATETIQAINVIPHSPPPPDYIEGAHIITPPPAGINFVTPPPSPLFPINLFANVTP